MILYLYNTISRQKEEFVPIDSNNVKMYVCGPTIYDIPHIGNARCMVIYDVLYRVLRLIYGVQNIVYVRNITDIDDKIIDRARELKINISKLTHNTIIDFHEDMNYLGCLTPTVEPRATDNIDVMINIIERLIQSKNAYVTNSGHVYFSVKSFKDYNILSNRVFKDMIPNVRIEESQQKRYFADFVLWKPAKDESDDVNSVFKSPWGIGRPGWHIECSAMSYKFLGKNFDIHGGGVDLIFPHHSNEIAQSRCAFPGSNYASYWVHNGFLTVRGEKMSKSLGNFITVRDLRKQNIAGEIIRLMFLNTHYRKPLDFSDKVLYDAKNIINSLYDTLEYVNMEVGNNQDLQCKSVSDQDLKNQEYISDFINAILDDLNTYKAITCLLRISKQIKIEVDIGKKVKLAKTLLYAGNLIGILQLPQQALSNDKVQSNNEIQEDNINLLIEQRMLAKKEKNWQLADQIRLQLLKQGINLTDQTDGTTSWKVKK